MSSISSLSNLSFKMLCEMNDKAQRLVKLMKQGIVEFLFTKISTGKDRKAHGTLRRDLIPKEAQRKRGRPRKRPDYLVIYYDTDKQSIRSFRDEMLKKILSKPKVPDDIKKDEDEESKDEKSSKDNKKNHNV